MRKAICAMTRLTLPLKTTSNFAALLQWENKSQATDMYLISKTQRDQTKEKRKTQNAIKKCLTLYSVRAHGRLPKNQAP